MPARRFLLSAFAKASLKFHRFARDTPPRTEEQRSEQEDGGMPYLPNELLLPILLEAIRTMTLAQKVAFSHIGRRIMHLTRPEVFRTAVIPACPWGDPFRYSTEAFSRHSGLRPLVENLHFNGQVAYSHRARPFDLEIDPEHVVRFCSRFPNLATLHLEHMTCNVPIAYYTCTPPYPIVPSVKSLTIDLNETTSAVDLLISLLPSLHNVSTLTIAITRVINVDFCNLLADLLARKTIKSKRLRLGYCSQDKTPLINQCLRIAGPRIHHLTLDLVAIDPEQHEDHPSLYLSIRRAVLLKTLVVTIPYEQREWIHEAEATVRPLMKLLRTCPASLEDLTIEIITTPKNYDDLCGALACIPLHDMLVVLGTRAPRLKNVELHLDLNRAPGSGPDVGLIWEEAYRRSPMWYPENELPTVSFT